MTSLLISLAVPLLVALGALYTTRIERDSLRAENAILREAVAAGTAPLALIQAYGWEIRHDAFRDKPWRVNGEAGRTLLEAMEQAEAVFRARREPALVRAGL